jgi:hypothetical protein
MRTALNDLCAKKGNRPVAIKAAERAVEFADTRNKPATR